MDWDAQRPLFVRQAEGSDAARGVAGVESQLYRSSSVCAEWRCMGGM